MRAGARLPGVWEVVLGGERVGGGGGERWCRGRAVGRVVVWPVVATRAVLWKGPRS